MKGDYCIWQSVFYSFIYLYTYTLYLYLKAICKGKPLPESSSRYYSTWQFSGQYYKKNFFLVCKSTIPFPPNQERQYLFSRDFLLPFSNVCYHHHSFLLSLCNPCVQSHLPFCLGDIPINQMTVGVHTTGAWKLAIEIHYDSLWYLGQEVPNRTS